MSKLTSKAALARSLALAGALLGLPAYAQATTVWVASSTQKVRPADAPGNSTSASISAAKNEFEAFQVVIQGPATGVQATVSDLTGAGTIPSSNISMYREAIYQANNPSGPDGATGPWPDGLVPDVDAYAHEKRNAFPFDVPAGEERAIWVDVLVPADATPGSYSGTVTLTGTGLPNGTVDVPVSLNVWHFALPSTPSLKTAFGMWWNGPCQAEYGSGTCPDPEGLRSLYVQAALDNRISLEGAIDQPPPTGNWTAFDQTYGPLLDGTASTRLAGAKLSEVRFQGSRDVTTASDWASHFRSKGWFGALFDYTCDEPPITCAWSDIPARASIMRDADPQFRTLVTTTIDQATANGAAGSISVMVPVVNDVEPKGAASTRSAYDTYVSGGNELWWYQSCMSHGCGGAFGAAAGSVGTTDPAWAGWPTYAIDASGVRNRAMEWLSYRDGMTAELYYETMMHSDTAWTDQYDFGGNGDGTLFYPGRPDVISGTTHVPVESIRLKLIREGIEDYEYLKMLNDLGDGDWAMGQVNALFPSAGDLDGVTADQLLAVRDALAARIESHVAPSTTGTTTSTGGTSNTTGGTGSGTTSGTSPGSSSSSGSTGGGSTITGSLPIGPGVVTGTSSTSSGSTGGGPPGTAAASASPTSASSAAGKVKGGCSSSGGELGLLSLGTAMLIAVLRRRRT